ncbi:DUF3489 domain-containing protein [Rhodophyticola porphyridii]|uniref:DUF3489 domain-containing protein n=1 Tax=Rhodophyticola porphyridii TaxID=1852017 RepID=UPI0035CF4E50
MTEKSTRSSEPGRGANRAPTSRRTSKKDQLIRMLSAKAGAEIGAVSKKLGWQTHTTRAALSGLRKAGFELVGETPGDGKPRRYRIVARPADTGKTDVPGATDAR